MGNESERAVIGEGGAGGSVAGKEEAGIQEEKTGGNRLENDPEGRRTNGSSPQRSCGNEETERSRVLPRTDETSGRRLKTKESTGEEVRVEWTGVGRTGDEVLRLRAMHEEIPAERVEQEGAGEKEIISN